MKSYSRNSRRRRLSSAIALAVAPTLTFAQFNAEELLADIDGNNGFVVRGENDIDQIGITVSEAGDINGDGIDDVIIGAETEELDRLTAYVVYGSTTNFNAAIPISEINGTNGFVINGETAGITGTSFLGSIVSAVGDLNNDGISDIAFGDDRANNGTGRVYVVYGDNNGFSNPFDLAGLDGNNGFTINGINEYDGTGNAISAAGDVNGDGIDDLILGADYRNNTMGAAYVLFGIDGGPGSTVNLADLDGTNGFAISGLSPNDAAGSAVTTAGDINGDGVSDIAIGAPGSVLNGSGINMGAAFIIFGTNSGFTSPLNLLSLDGTNGFSVTGIDSFDALGDALGSLDINGDGLSDLVIGAAGGDGLNNTLGENGETYVVLGRDTGFPATFNAASLSDNDNSDGFTIFGAGFFDTSGSSVSSAGDINDDGLDDLIIGSPNANTPTTLSSGQSHILFGDPAGFASIVNLTELDGDNGVQFTGVADSDISGDAVSGAGDVNGDGIDDFIIGARNTIRGNPDPAVMDPNFVQAAGDAYVVFGRRFVDIDIVFANGFEG